MENNVKIKQEGASMLCTAVPEAYQHIRCITAHEEGNQPAQKVPSAPAHLSPVSFYSKWMFFANDSRLPNLLFTIESDIGS